MCDIIPKFESGNVASKQNLRFRTSFKSLHIPDLQELQIKCWILIYMPRSFIRDPKWSVSSMTIANLKAILVSIGWKRFLIGMEREAIFIFLPSGP